MRSVKWKLLIVCTVVGWLTLMGSSIQTADAARWSFHFKYTTPDGQVVCPGGDLEVWATKDCVRRLLLFKGYAKHCKKYVGPVPGAPYNDVIFDFYWDFECRNEDHIKIALPGWNGTNWELKELPPWIDAHVAGDIPPIISVGDPTGKIQRVHIVVDPVVWRDHNTGVVLPEYDIKNGTHPDLPGYLIGTTPIQFDPLGPASGPFSTTPLNGTLYRDGEIELIPEPQQPPQPVFEQLHWVGPFEPVADSSWGKVTLEINQPRGFYYLNLSVDTDGNQQYTPAIRNMSIQTTGQTQTISSFFDIFVEEQNKEPHPVPQLNYMYSIDEKPQQEPPMAEPMTTQVTPLPYQVGGEEDVIVGRLPDLVYPLPRFCVIKKSGQLPNLDQFVNQWQPTNYCAPGAISNSLTYLKATGGIDSTVDTSIGTVASQIGTTSGGTSSNWYQKKQSLPYFTNIVTTRYIEAPLDAAEIDDLINELNRGQDIEMDLIGHVEVLAGLRVRCDGTIELDLFDDNQADLVSDPMHTSIIDESTGTPRVDGMVLERFVIECPIEEEIGVLLPYLFIDTYNDWLLALENGVVRAMTLEEGEGYLWQWNRNNQEVEVEGEPYPQDPFIPSELYVYEGGGEGGLEPNDAGLVMGWGNQDGDSTSAWVVKYDEDPDFTNCIITLVVTAPQWAMTNPGSQINKVSFGLGNPPAGTGPVRSWNWDCGPGKTIQWNTPTVLKIDTSKTGMTAATPTADGYTNNLAFNLATVTWLCVDENGTWVGPPNPAPQPGGFQFLWNYWHWILVSPKTTVDKGIYKKWSQPPVVLNPNDDPPIIQGWDEYSDYRMPPVVADDWECKDNRPITDIHWWGSYFKDDDAAGNYTSWTQPFPPVLPKAFHIGIWTNIPAGATGAEPFSHPGRLIWENYCDNFVWNFAGYDLDPRKLDINPNLPTEPGHDESMEACFQFTQLLSQGEWFYQEPSDDPDNPRIYWLSIAPIWDNDETEWHWGWKTRPWYFEDDAVSIRQLDPWPPVVGTTKWISGIPLQYPPYPDPEGVSWDVAFELTTNEGLSADLYPDGIVNFKDLAILANQWLETIP